MLLFLLLQVWIPASDVEVISDGIHVVSKNLTLGKNEYLTKNPTLPGTNYSGNSNQTVYAVCIDDYDPNFASGAGVSIHGLCFSAFNTVILHQLLYFLSV